MNHLLFTPAERRTVRDLKPETEDRPKKMPAAGPRPVFVTVRAARAISVRATADMMARVAKLIADNDKK